MSKIALFLLLLPVFGLSQPKNCNVIKVSGVGFNECIEKLLDMGYTIEKKDEAFQTATTDKATVVLSNYYWINVRVKDSVLWVTSKTEWWLLGYKQMSQGINAGGKNLSPRITFTKMNDFAKAFDRPIEYLVTPIK